MDYAQQTALALTLAASASLGALAAVARFVIPLDRALTARAFHADAKLARAVGNFLCAAFWIFNLAFCAQSLTALDGNFASVGAGGSTAYYLADHWPMRQAMQATVENAIAVGLSAFVVVLVALRIPRSAEVRAP